MAITVELESDDVITPAELLEWVDGNIDPLDPEDMLKAAPMLRALANNRTFINDAVLEELKLAVGRDDRNAYIGRQISAQSILYGGRGHFSVRSNLWSTPVVDNAVSKKHTDRVFSYITPHDHNFGLLTVGYAGPGYRTTIYEYDHRSVEGRPGEFVDIRFLEDTHLSPGRILYFRPSTDIHAQFYPAAPSISLNLISSHPSVRKNAQYEFDLEKGQIIGLLHQTSVLNQLALLKFAGRLGTSDGEIPEVLRRIGASHYSPHVRGAALRAFAALRSDAESMSYVERTIRDDESPLVRELLKTSFVGRFESLAGQR